MLSEEKVASPTPSTTSSEPQGAPSTPVESQKGRARPYHRVPSEEKTKDYREMRVKNNQACREWRQKRKRTEAAKDERILQLTARVLELEQRIAYLNGQLDSLKK